MSTSAANMNYTPSIDFEKCYFLQETKPLHTINFFSTYINASPRQMSIEVKLGNGLCFSQEDWNVLYSHRQKIADYMGYSNCSDEVNFEGLIESITTFGGRYIRIYNNESLCGVLFNYQEWIRLSSALDYINFRVNVLIKLRKTLTQRLNYFKKHLRNFYPRDLKSVQDLIDPLCNSESYVDLDIKLNGIEYLLNTYYFFSEIKCYPM